MQAFVLPVQKRHHPQSCPSQGGSGGGRVGPGIQRCYNRSNYTFRRPP